ncbi:cytochrome P450 6k1-like [Ptiloglossa arizonensis]|uniref:cytochrome P450 6k1-like n=1 Tax=Ptiloglossa arizonensis TaxID=3350558 RepID=UPI003FA15FDA
MAILTPYWGLDGIMFITFLMIAAYLYMTRKFKYWAKRGIMEIPPTPFLGNFGDCILQKKAPAEFVRDLYRESKGLPYMGFYLFDKPSFLVRDPQLIKHILVKDFNSFSDRYSSANVKDRLGYANLFQMKNPGWRILRSKLTPIFTSGKLKKMFDLMVMVTKDLDNYLESLNFNVPKQMDIKNMCCCFTTDMIGTTAFGLNVNSLRDPKAPFRQAGKKVFDYQLIRGLELLIIFFVPHLTKYTGAIFFGKEASDYLRTTFWNIVNHRIQTGEKRNDVIDLLIELKQKHEHDTDISDFTFNGDDLVAQAVIFYSAGFDTSSTTMCYTLYEVALNMDIQRTLRKEILDALEETGGNITYEMVQSLTYLDMVVSETLRRYPPLAFLDRVCLADYKVPDSDLVLEKGTPVYVPMMGLHNDPEYFPEPEKYDPERFTDENKQKRPNFVYFPFGEGPHTCIGFRMGLMQSKLGIIQVLSKYEVTPCKKTPIPVRQNPKGMTTTPVGGMHLNLMKIS